MNEKWKDIEGYEGYYQVSNTGKVKSVERVVIRKNGASNPIRERILRPSKDKGGYLGVSLCINSILKSFRVHRLVAHAFLDNKNNKPEVNHIDGIKTNNRSDNLEWCTSIENKRHAIDMGLSPKGASGRHNRAKLKVEDILKIRKLYSEGNKTKRDLAREYGVHSGTIWCIVLRKSWQHI